MNAAIANNFAIFLPLFFATIWLVCVTLLGLLSGWFRLMERYSDRDEKADLRLRYQSGIMGFYVSMSGILSFEVCRSGLRIGLMRIFGPFCRDLFIPWEELQVERSSVLIWPHATLRFGNPSIGALAISTLTANSLARAAKEHWPEPGPVPEDTRAGLIKRLFTLWALQTLLAAGFFIVTPRVAFPKDDAGAPPVLVAILFPAIVFGVIGVITYLSRKGQLSSHD